MTALNTKLRGYLWSNPASLALDRKRSDESVRELDIKFDEERFVNHVSVPYLLPASRYDALCEDAQHVFNALDKVVAAYGHDGRVTDYFSHLGGLDRLLSLPGPINPSISIAAFNIIESLDGRFQVVEPNTCCPEGLIWTSMFYEILRHSRVHQYLASLAAEVAVPMHNGSTAYDYLIAEHDRMIGKRETYRFCVADTRTAPMMTELLEMRNGARERGHASERGQIQDFSYDGQRLLLDGKAIDIVHQYLDVLFTDDMAQIAANYDEIAPLLQAISDRKVLAINSFRPMLISEDKSILALIQDPAFQDMFSTEEASAVEALVPATYRLAPGQVMFEGERHDLIPLLRRRKDDFMVKAQMECMGRGITIGRTTSQAQWDDLIDRQQGGMFVAQRFIETPTMLVPDPKSDGITLKPMHYTLGLFLLGGKAQGMCNRVAPGLITNVGQGGAFGDVFIYEDR